MVIEQVGGAARQHHDGAHGPIHSFRSIHVSVISDRIVSACILIQMQIQILRVDNHFIEQLNCTKFKFKISFYSIAEQPVSPVGSLQALTERSSPQSCQTSMQVKAELSAIITGMSDIWGHSPLVAWRRNRENNNAVIRDIPYFRLLDSRLNFGNSQCILYPSSVIFGSSAHECLIIKVHLVI